MRLRHCGDLFIFGEDYLTSLGVRSEYFAKAIGEKLSRKGSISRADYSEVIEILRRLERSSDPYKIEGHQYMMLRKYIEVAQDDQSGTLGVYWKMSWWEFFKLKVFYND